jgi:hypothetical protein
MEAMTEEIVHEQRWHVTREIPIALVVTLGLGLVTQAAAALWWASSIENRIARLEDTDKRIDATIATRIKLSDERFERLNSERERVIRIEEQIKYIVDTIRRIDTKLDATTR